MPHRTIHLFRKGLRLHDHPALLAALESSEVVYPIYILDRKFMTSVMHIGALRWHFLLQSLEDLQKNLCRLGSHLLVIQGEYEPVLREHVQKWNITQVTLDAEMEPFYKEMEANIRCLGEELGFEVLSVVGHSLYDTKRYVIALKTSEVSPGGFSKHQGEKVKYFGPSGSFSFSENCTIRDSGTACWRIFVLVYWKQQKKFWWVAQVLGCWAVVRA